MCYIIKINKVQWNQYLKLDLAAGEEFWITLNPFIGIYQLIVSLFLSFSSSPW